MDQYLGIILFIFLTVATTLGLDRVFRRWRPRRLSPLMKKPLNGGDESVGPLWPRRSSRYQGLIVTSCTLLGCALILFPALVSLRGWASERESLRILMRLGVFLSLIGLGILFVLRRNTLTWSPNSVFLDELDSVSSKNGEESHG